MRQISISISKRDSCTEEIRLAVNSLCLYVHTIKFDFMQILSMHTYLCALVCIAIYKAHVQCCHTCMYNCMHASKSMHAIRVLTLFTYTYVCISISLFGRIWNWWNFIYKFHIYYLLDIVAFFSAWKFSPHLEKFPNRFFPILWIHVGSIDVNSALLITTHSTIVRKPETTRTESGAVWGKCEIEIFGAFKTA